MPPKPKFTKEEIVQTALQAVSQGGEDLTAKELDDALGSSSRSIFTVFNSMKEVQDEVRSRDVKTNMRSSQTPRRRAEPDEKSDSLCVVLFEVQLWRCF